MNKALLTVVTALLLCGAAPLPRLVPATPLLGRPATLIVPLPEPDWELAGLPDLAPFELLAPPQRAGQEVHLLLMPLRAGQRQLPPLPLHHEGKAAGATQSLTVTVNDDLPANAVPAPLNEGLLTRSALLLRRGLIAFGVGLALLFLLWRYYYARPPRPLPLSALPPQQLLAALERRLDQAGNGDETALQALRERIAALRFGPLPPEPEELEQLLHDVLAVSQGAA